MVNNLIPPSPIPKGKKVVSKFKSLFNSENKKQIIFNFASLSVLKGFDFLIPLITLPYLVRVVGVENYGIINFALSLALYFGAIIQYGFAVTATREVARNRKNKETLSKIYSTTLTISLLLAILSGAIFNLIVISVDKFDQYFFVYFFSILFIIMQSAFPIWFFQGMEKMKFIAYLTLGTKILFLIGLFIFVTKEDDYFLVPLLNAAAALLSLIGAIWVIKKKFMVSFVMPRFDEIVTLLASGQHAFITQLAPNLYNNSTTFLLGLFTNNLIVGYFSVATKVIDALISIGFILSNTFFPYLSRNINSHKIFQKIMLVVGSAVTVFIIMFSESIVSLLFTKQNIVIVEYIEGLAFGILMVFIHLTYSTNFLMLIGKDRIAKNIALYTSLIFFLLALLIIPSIGIWGGIIILVGARFSMGFFSFFYYRKFKSEMN